MASDPDVLPIFDRISQSSIIMPNVCMHEALPFGLPEEKS